jgi:hypothetical protein
MSVRSLRLALTLRDWRQAFVALVLAAFVAQGILTQSHWHLASGDTTLAAFDASADADHRAPKAPVKGDQNNCPICHAASIAGAFFASAAPMLRVPSLSTLFKPRDERVIVVERFAGHWRSRAPPLV